MHRHTLAELRFRQLDQVNIISGDFGEFQSIKNQINAVDLSADKNGFRIILRDNNAGLVEQIGQVGSLSDCFGNFGIRLDERFLGAVHELKADLQRGTAALHLGRSCIGFYGIHILALIGIDRANLATEWASRLQGTAAEY